MTLKKGIEIDKRRKENPLRQITKNHCHTWVIEDDSAIDKRNVDFKIDK